MTRLLTSFDHVIEALGDLKAAAALVGVSPAAVCHWRARTGRFPARTMERIQAELMCRGTVAARCVWDFDPPKTFDDEPKRAKRA